MAVITRRHALLGATAAGLGACASTMNRQSFTSMAPLGSATFAHGVASGDPQAESVVLWTRITTDAPRLGVTAEVATDPEFATIIATIATETDGSRDHTVKVVPTGLTPGGTYYYRFRVGAEVSPVGRTRTLPEATVSARFAVVSCSNYPFGYFNAYDHIARDNSLDAVIHLGDYIYEYGPGGYGAAEGAALGRIHTPQREIVSLQDYRQRHGQYKADPASRAMHAAHALICIWDDHETANNSWERGAENHQPATEGDWEARKRAALQAYYEWMPVRDPEPGRAREALYGEYRWGGLLSLAKIETRLTARTEQINLNDAVQQFTSPEAIEAYKRDVIGGPDRALLGAAQTDYLDGVLTRSVDAGEPWRLIANQVIMAEIITPDLSAHVTEEQIVDLEKEWDQARAFVEVSKFGLPLNLDAWDGYPAAREAFYRMSKKAGARDLIVLTGDTHEFWANDLMDASGGQMGVELGTSAVTSPGPTKYLGEAAFDYSLLLRQQVASVRYHDPLHRGYIRLSLNEDRGQAEYVALSTISSPTYDAFTNARFDLVKSGGTVKFANPTGLGFKERVVY